MKEKKFLYDWCVENNRQDLIESLLKARVDIDTIKTIQYASKRELPFFCLECKEKYDELIKTNPNLPQFYIQKYEVQKKTIGKNKCRVCNCRGKNGLIPGVNDLETYCLQNEAFRYLLEEWDYEKNIEPEYPSSPNVIPPNYMKEVNWKCKNGHEWTAAPNSRVNTGNGCKQCSEERRKSKAEKTVYYYIKQVFPNAIDNYKISKESRLELDIYIEELSLGIEYDGFWHNKNTQRDINKYEICKENNIKLIRIREKQCVQIENIADICYYLKQDNNNDLNNAIHFLFDYIKTITDKIFETPDINWKRDIHKAEEFIDIRIKEKSVASYPLLLEQWHPTKNGNMTPDRVPAKSNIPRYWRCKKCGYGLNEGDDWIVSPNARIENEEVNGCPVCGNKILRKGYNDFETCCNNKGLNLLLKEWNEEENSKLITQNGELLTKDNILFGSGGEVYWICSKCGYGSKNGEWKTPLKRRTISGIGCPVCSGKIVKKGYNDIATTHPEIAKQWDDEKNLKEFRITKYEISKGFSEYPVYWLCDKGHSYKAYPNDRTGGKHIGCSICSNREILVGYNDLETFCNNEENREANAHLLEEWYKFNKLKPNEVVYGSSEIVKWECQKCHNIWSAEVRNRVTYIQKNGKLHKGTGCDKCARKQKAIDLRIKKTKGKELSKINPKLAEEWHPDPNKNYDEKRGFILTPYNTAANSHDIVWWKCSNPKCGHEWPAQVNARNKGSGCPECYKTNRKKKNG